MIQADAQTGLDQLLGTHASHAPGPVNNGRDFLDGSLDLSLNKWRWRLGIRDRDNVGSGAGIASALDPTGSSRMRSVTSDLSYDDDNLAPNWMVSAQLSASHYSEKSDLTLFPAGMNFGGPTFTDGMIGNPYKWERQHRLHTAATYTGTDRHRIRLGVGAESANVYRIQETKNFNPDFSPIGSRRLNFSLRAHDKFAKATSKKPVLTILPKQAFCRPPPAKTKTDCQELHDSAEQPALLRAHSGWRAASSSCSGCSS